MAVTTVMELGYPSSGTQEAIIQAGRVKSGYQARSLHVWALGGMVQAALRKFKPHWTDTKAGLVGRPT